MFAGSILDLEAGTAGTQRLAMTDPDGGGATRVVTVATRPDPKPYSGGRVYHEGPADVEGAQGAALVRGPNCAYNYHCGGGDESMAECPRSPSPRHHSRSRGRLRIAVRLDARNSSTRPVEGTYYLFGNGTADKPIVIKAVGDGDVTSHGRGNFNLFNVQKANYNYFEGDCVWQHRDCDPGGAPIALPVASGLTVKHCRFANINLGIVTKLFSLARLHHHRQRLLGRDDPNHLQGWNGDFWPQVRMASKVRSSLR